MALSPSSWHVILPLRPIAQRLACLRSIGGVIPGGLVSKAMNVAVNYRDALYYSITGKPFQGKEAVRMGLVNKFVPDDQLEAEVMKLARQLAALNPETVRATKQAIKATREMTVEQVTSI